MIRWSWLFVLLFCAAWTLFPLFRPALPQSLSVALALVAMAGASLLLGWVGLVLQHEMSPAVAGGTVAAVASIPQAVSYLFWAASPARHLERLPFVAPALVLMGAGSALLIGVYRLRGSKEVIAFREGSWVEILALLVAALDAFWMILKRSLSLFDTLALLGAFSLYIVWASRLEPSPPAREGPLSDWRRLHFPFRQTALFLLGGAAAILLLLSWKDMTRLAAYPGQGTQAHWALALIDESPVLLTVILLAAQDRPRLALRVLVAGLVVQSSCWVGLIPLGPVLARRALAFSLNPLQVSGLAVYAAMLFYAVLLLSGLELALWGGISLAGLSVAAFLLEGPAGSWTAAALVTCACVLLVLYRRRVETWRSY